MFWSGMKSLLSSPKLCSFHLIFSRVEFCLIFWMECDCNEIRGKFQMQGIQALTKSFCSESLSALPKEARWAGKDLLIKSLLIFKARLCQHAAN